MNNLSKDPNGTLNPNESKFKNFQGVYLTKALFWETAVQEEKEHVIYTLKDYEYTTPDGKVLPSLKQAYLEDDDPTEYSFSNRYLGGWLHWQKLSQSSFFSEHIDQWREEKAQKELSELVGIIQTEARDKNSKNRYGAAKTLLDKPWDKTPNKRGRKSKEEIKDEAKKLVKEHQAFNEDYERLGLNETTPDTDTD